MTNYSVFNNQNNPLYTQINNAYNNPAVVTTPDGSASINGRLFTVTSASTAVGGGSNLLIQITNPNLSGRTLYVSQITGGISAAATINVYSGGTVTGGTTPTPFNLNFGNATTSIATARVVSGTVTGTPTVFLTALLAAGQFAFPFIGAIVVPPNRSITISVGTGAITAAANITWWEY
ncbi:hypothetical protein [Paenibacillus radicis (ex Gao et al. 2016)]|uniref:Uncharacterized protein n=1 Tax=Paenibacillus radicis (ex Gao et al. 2016) TaxID=1737354 RepID=A0A917HD51_9BACL|nr:hypothetical protein [Paenibacillus radicis (ex Gao et al. 2016)]GGG74153.1 hypothetical protein GCM10010918_32850 [Paenibacillus radicis (ex Gao et al. 2016)]